MSNENKIVLHCDVCDEYLEFNSQEEVDNMQCGAMYCPLSGGYSSGEPEELDFNE